MERWRRHALLLAGALALVGLAYVYARELATAAEIDWLEQLPVLEHDPS